MNPNACRTYQIQSVMTASPVRLVAMLYDRAIGSLREAVRAIEAGDIETRCRANAKAIEIISHLTLHLDLEQGGEIASDLGRIYRFVLGRLPQIDIRNDSGPAEEVIELLEPMRQAWHDLADRGSGTASDTADEAAATPARRHSDSQPGEAAGDRAAGVSVSA